MLTGKTIICFANDYKGDPTSKQQVMRILSESNTVIWVNSIVMRKPSATSADMGRIFTKIKRFFRGLEQINEKLYVFTPLVLPLPSSKTARLINEYLLEVYLKCILWKLNLKNIQIWTFVPNMVGLLGRLNEEKVVYYCVDEWSEFSFLDKENIVRLERTILEKADIVITTGDRLFQSKRTYNKNTYLIPHGVDFDFFAQTQSALTVEPADINALPHPRIGFFGLIHNWIDLEIVGQIAEKHPEWSIVMIGKVDPTIDISALKTFANIHFLGQRDYEELPSYCKGFDVALIPFVINELTLNVNPIKLREYLAAGLPVVATALPEIVKYSPPVYIAEQQQDFTGCVEKALLERGPSWVKTRQEAVSGETWRARVNQISDYIENAK